MFTLEVYNTSFSGNRLSKIHTFNIVEHIGYNIMLNIVEINYESFVKNKSRIKSKKDLSASLLVYT